MTALEGELDACGGADAPPSAAARLKANVQIAYDEIK